MRAGEIGKMVHTLRKRQRFTKGMLAYGICTERDIERLEIGEKMPDLLTLEAIISRLGKSVNKLEMLVEDGDYIDCGLYRGLEESVAQGNREETEGLIRILRTQPKWRQPAYFQCRKRMEFIVNQPFLGKSRECCLLRRALCATLPDFSVWEVHKYLLGEEEILLALMWLKVRGEMGDAAAYAECGYFMDCLEKRNYDEEIWVSVYPKLAWVYLELERAHGGGDSKHLEKELRLVRKVRALLTENGVLQHFTEFLETELGILEKLGREDELESLKRQRDALKWAYDRYGQKYRTGEIEIWKTYRQQNIYLLQETVKRERGYLNLTQEKAAELAGLDQKTLSRIETGANRPKPGTFERLRKALQMERNYCDTKIDVEDFETLELERQVTKAHIRRDYEETERLLEQLKKKMPLKSRKNCQYMQSITTQIAYGRKEMDVTEALQNAIQAFELSRKLDQNTLKHIQLNHVENTLLAFIAQCYNDLGNRKEAIGLLEAVLQSYHESKLEERDYYKELTVILGWLTDIYEEDGQFAKAMEYSERNIRLEFQCVRCNLLARRIMENIYICERRGDSPKDCIPLYQNVYRLLLLFNPNEIMMKYLKAHLEESYPGSFRFDR